MKQRLMRVQIEPTNRCNFRCVNCRRTYWSRPNRNMPLEKFLMVLDQLPPVSRFHLQGVGEPLLNRDLPKMIRSSKASGASVGKFTNASLLSRNIAEELLDSCINRINLSINSTGPHTFKVLRSGIPFESIVYNIAELAGLRSKIRYPDTELALSLVITPQTLKTLQDIVKPGADLGLDEVYLQNINSEFIPSNNIERELIHTIDKEIYRKVVHKAGKAAKNAAIRFSAPDLNNQDHTYLCKWPFHGCNITWDGFMSPRCLQPDPEVLNFGNLFKEDFEKIWHSKPYRIFRDRVMNDIKPICAECPERYGLMWHPAGNPLAIQQP